MDKKTPLSPPAAYFDAAAQEYASAYAARSPAGEALRVRQQRALELLDQPVGKVLDVGCGPGILVQELLRLGGEAWGVDAAPGMIEECRRRVGNHPGAHFDIGDATHLAFPDGSFDAAVCLGVIDHIRAYDSVIHELIRVVKRGGVLLVSFPNLLSPYASWRRFVFYPVVGMLRSLYLGLTTPHSPALRLSYRRRLYTVRIATALIARHGAEVTDIAHYHPNVFLSPLDELLSSWALAASKKLERPGSWALKWLGIGFIVKARKL